MREKERHKRDKKRQIRTEKETKRAKPDTNTRERETEHSGSAFGLDKHDTRAKDGQGRARAAR